MMIAALIEQNQKLRAKVAQQSRQLKTFHYPHVYFINMAVWLLLGFLLGIAITGGF